MQNSENTLINNYLMHRTIQCRDMCVIHLFVDGGTEMYPTRFSRFDFIFPYQQKKNKQKETNEIIMGNHSKNNYNKTDTF